MSAASQPFREELARDARNEQLAMLGLSAPALVLVGVILVLPTLWLVWLSFLDGHGALSLVNYQRLISEPSYGRILLTTFEIGALTTLLCVVFGCPLAYVLAQLPARIANLCMLGVLMPFWTSILVRTYAWLVLLQRHGVINSWGISLGLWKKPLALVYNFDGTLIGLVHIMLPFLILPVYGSMRAIDDDFVKAAANLGASPTQAFWRVFLPLSLPGVYAGILMVFILCLGAYVTPEMLGGGRVIMVANGIATNIQVFFNWGAASALGVVLMVLTALILWIAVQLAGADRLFGGAWHMNWLRAPASATQVTHGARLWLYASAIVVMAFLVLPTLIVMPMSFSASEFLEFPPQHWSLRWYAHYFHSPEWLQATATSFKVALLTVVVAVPLGTAAAYGLRLSRSGWARLALAVLLTPILVPIILVAIGIFYVYVKLKLLHTIGGLVLAHSMLAVPLVIMVMSSALKSFDFNQEMAARSLGASRLSAFWLVMVPYLRFALVTSAVLSFLTSFDEVVVAMFISGGTNATLTRAMFDALRDQIDPTIAAIATIMILLSSFLVILSQFIGGPRR